MSSRRWFYKVYPLIKGSYKKKKFRCQKLTKKKIKQISYMSCKSPQGGSSYHAQFFKYFQLHAVIIRLKQLMCYLLNNVKLKKIKSLYKHSRTKKNRLYLSNLFNLIESYVCINLYNNFLITKPKVVERLSKYNMLLINDKVIKNSKARSKISDVVGLKQRLLEKKNKKFNVGSLSKKFKKLLLKKFNSKKKIAYNTSIIKKKYIIGNANLNKKDITYYYNKQLTRIYDISTYNIFFQESVLKHEKLNNLSCKFKRSSLCDLTIVCFFLKKILSTPQ